ncbi:MAG: thiamine pyrophosphate-binding protein [Nannocystaceae bacterium]
MPAYLTTELPQRSNPAEKTADGGLRAGPARAADILVASIESLGVDSVFGIPGGALAPLLDAFRRAKALHYVVTAHECSAAYAAAGYYEATGKTGIMAVTSGPGLLNAVNGIAAAYVDQRPLVIISGEVGVRVSGRGGIQDGSAQGLRVVEIVRPFVKKSVSLTDPQQLSIAFAAAVDLANTYPKGPVLLSTPIDVLGGRARSQEIELVRHVDYSVSERALRQVATALLSPGRKLVVAGGGAREEAARAPLERLLLSCPDLYVGTTIKGKGTVRESHPRHLGVIGMAGHPSAHAFIQRGLDVVLVLGSALGEMGTDAWAPGLQPDKLLIQIDVDVEKFTRSFAPNLAVRSPVPPFLRALNQHIEGAAQEAVEARPSRVEFHRSVRVRGSGVGRGHVARSEACRTDTEAGTASGASLRLHTDPKKMSVGPTGRITACRVLWELQTIMPRDCIYVVDAGNNLFSAAHYLRIERAWQFVGSQTLASMGSSIGIAMGIQCGQPGKTVVCIIGDGGLRMQEGELATISREKFPIFVLALDDERQGMVDSGQTAQYGASAAYERTVCDMTMLASAHGIHAISVTEPGDILRQSPVDLLCRGPVLAHAKIDAFAGLPPNSRFSSIEKQGCG